MKNYKQLIIGILIGSIATISITAFAQYIVNPNPYPVYVDGEKVALEGYNINDKTYFQLRDVGDKVGFGVTFANNIILVNTVPFPTPKPTPTIMPASIPLPDVTVRIEDGVKYVKTFDVEDMLDDIGLGSYEFAGRLFHDRNDSTGAIILNDIPINDDNHSLIPLDYYLSVIVPIINSLR